MKDLKNIGPITSVEDFCPDDGFLDRSFLEDNNHSYSQASQKRQVESDRFVIGVSYILFVL